MRYAIFTDIHANLEALEAVLAKIDEIAAQNPIDEIWFLGDLVGYGPDPNECIRILCDRTKVIIAGNHDWAAVGKIDLDDFSPAARISAEWTAQQLTEEHRTFLTNLPERLEIGDFTLVHGSPYGPLWEYLTSEALAERSFQCFSSRYCVVGHTHVPIIFQQPDPIADTPTMPLSALAQSQISPALSNGTGHAPVEADAAEEHASEAEVKVPSAQTTVHTEHGGEHTASAYAEPVTEQATHEHAPEATTNGELEHMSDAPTQDILTTSEAEATADSAAPEIADAPSAEEHTATDGSSAPVENVPEDQAPQDRAELKEEENAQLELLLSEEFETNDDDAQEESLLESEEEQLAEVMLLTDDIDIEELRVLLGISQSMVPVTNAMSAPPEGPWQAKVGYRAIINPGGVGQPRDGDPRAAFMIYDTEHGFEFYRIEYPFEKTQEKIIQANLPSYLAVRLAYGR